MGEKGGGSNARIRDVLRRSTLSHGENKAERAPTEGGMSHHGVPEERERMWEGRGTEEGCGSPETRRLRMLSAAIVALNVLSDLKRF